MTSRTFRLAIGATALLLVFALVILGGPASQAQEPEGNFGVGIPEVFVPKYLNYRARQLADPKPNVMRIRLGYVKGLSRSFTRMAGDMAVDLGTGSYSLSLNGLTPLTTYSVWAVDSADTVLTPLLPDLPVRLSTLLATGPTAILTGLLGSVLPAGFSIDRVLVTPGLLFTGQPLAAGAVNVFQKMFFRRLTLVNDATEAVLFEDTTTPPPFFALVPDLAAETDPPPLLPLTIGLAGTDRSQLESAAAESSSRRVNVDKLISQGAELFFEETFLGNGRTCGTCHPSSNNLMIDPQFIASRPANDPLFVAEFNPALANLERPELMREFGLILENLDGLNDPVNRFVMRGVPHTLGMQMSLERDTSQIPTPAEMTGWSGDGSPGSGSLREFAIGAVTQHFTTSLQRVSGRDFNLPTDRQLDAMEAFQLSLGRNGDFDLTKITFNDQNVVTGQSLFINGTGSATAGGRCANCHGNAGAIAPNGQNRNFNTNVEDDLTHPARTVDDFPIDGGFGSPDAVQQNADGSFGNRTFNLAPVVEAADTAPFFHNNLANTLQDVVNFYNGPVFNNPNRAPAAQFAFNPTQLDQLVDFMRGINTLQNIDVAVRELKEIVANRKGNPRRETDTRLQTAFEDTDDAIRVLKDPVEGVLFETAINRLTMARSRISQAQVSNDTSQRRSLVQQAISELVGGRNAVATEAP
jgi:cytochrome c peroxidase